MKPYRCSEAFHSARLVKCVAVILFLIYELAHLLAPTNLKLALASSNSCHLREIEVCLVGVGSLLQNPNGLPANEEEMRRQCDFLDESSKCFQDYAERCLTRDQYQIADLLSNPIFEIKREFCMKGTELWKDYLKNAACLRDIQRKHQTSCATDFQVGFEFIHKINSSMRLATACCNMNRLRDCLLPRVEELCGEETFDMMSRLITRAVGKLPNTVCRHYESSQSGGECETLLPKTGTKPHCPLGEETAAKIEDARSFEQERIKRLDLVIERELLNESHAIWVSGCVGSIKRVVGAMDSQNLSTCYRASHFLIEKTLLIVWCLRANFKQAKGDSCIRLREDATCWN